MPNLWQTFYVTWRYITTSVSSRYHGSSSRENTPRSFIARRGENIGFRRYLRSSALHATKPRTITASLKTPIATQQQWTRTKEVKGSYILKPFKEHCRSLLTACLRFFFFSSWKKWEKNATQLRSFVKISRKGKTEVVEDNATRWTKIGKLSTTLGFQIVETEIVVISSVHI